MGLCRSSSVFRERLTLHDHSRCIITTLHRLTRFINVHFVGYTVSCSVCRPPPPPPPPPPSPTVPHQSHLPLTPPPRSAVIVGLAYPLLDRWLNSRPASGRDWASVTRCLALFVGINHANSRFQFATDAELAWTLALLSLALWWTFDRTTCGFVIASLAAAVAHVVAYYLVLRLVFR